MQWEMQKEIDSLTSHVLMEEQMNNVWRSAFRRFYLRKVILSSYCILHVTKGELCATVGKQLCTSLAMTDFKIQTEARLSPHEDYGYCLMICLRG